MKNSRFRHSYRKSASALHRKVGDTLRESEIFKHHEVYQEYPVNKVAKDYPHGSHHFDWVIPALKVIIECHGAQHYRPVAFDGNKEEAQKRFERGQERDRQKMASAQAAGWTYIVVPYTDEKKVDDTYLYELIKVAQNDTTGYTEEDVQKDELYDRQQERKAEFSRIAKERRAEYKASERYKQYLERAKEHRRRRYRELKERNDR